MAKNIEKNPFSLYDFLGHFIPGAMALTLFLIVYKGCHDILNSQDLLINNFIDVIRNWNDIRYFDISKFWDVQIYIDLIRIISKPEYNKGIVSVIFILVSYISGSLISYLSSQTIEKLLVKKNGYPSAYLMNRNRIPNFKELREITNQCCFIKKVTNKIKILKEDSYYCLIIKYKTKILVRLKKMCVCIKLARKKSSVFGILLYIFTFPIRQIICICSKKIRRYIMTPLDKEIIHAIEKKEEILAKKLLVDKHKETNDFHRVIMHYVYMNLEKSEVKTDNYIALYGFFRSITLIFCLYFDFLLLMGVVSFLLPGEKEFDLASFVFILCLGFICFISFMAFAKFYRRFTLENYMMLLSDTTITDTRNTEEITSSPSGK